MALRARARRVLAKTHAAQTDDRSGAAIAAKLGLPCSTVARWLTRAGLGRLSRLDPPEPLRRYQRERPGELVHLDIKKLGRFARRGHRITSTRRGCRNRGAGWDFVRVATDDATRLAYVEVLADERKATTTAFVLRALRWLRGHCITVERVMTDTGSAYRSRQFRKALRWLGIRHIYTRPYTPKTNGRAERFIQILLRDWVDELSHPSSAARNDDLPRWLDWFNRSRPHSALKGLAPISAVNNLMRNHA